MSKRIKVDDRSLERIKDNLDDELSEIIQRGNGEIEELMNFIKNKTSIEEEDIDEIPVSDSLQVYCIIRIVTFLETFCRGYFIRLIDTFGKDFPSTIETNLSHLKQLRKDSEITNGWIVADALNFQHFDKKSEKEMNIYKIFSTVLDIDLFAEMIKKQSKMPEIHESIIHLLKERHSVVHELKYSTWKEDDLTDAYQKVIYFIETLHGVIKEKR